MGNVDDAGFGENVRAVGGEAADNDGVGVEGLGKFEGAGAGGMESLRKAEMVESVDAVDAVHGRKAGRGKTAAKQVGCSLAHPFKAGLAGAVVEGQDEENPAAISLGASRRFRSLGKSRKARKPHESRAENNPRSQTYAQ
jgi:hypothetical protein